MIAKWIRTDSTELGTHVGLETCFLEGKIKADRALIGVSVTKAESGGLVIVALHRSVGVGSRKGVCRVSYLE